MIAVAVATVSRVAIMSLANYLVTPHWLLFAEYPGIESFEQAYEFTVSFVLPHSVIFNLTIALIVSPLSIRVYRVLTRTGILG
jgi:riboflavin transporter FmnP